MPEERLGNIPAIKKYFESGEHGHKVEMDELKALTSDERAELGEMCREALENSWS